MADPNPPEQPLYVSPEAEAIAGELEPPPPPSWPKVIGIISILFGALGLVCGGANAAFMVFMPRMVANIPGGAPPALMNPDPMIIAAAGVGALWAILLIVAGGMTAARNPAGRGLHLVWAVVAIVLGAVGMYLSMRMQASINEWVQQNPDSQFAQGQNPIGQIIGYVCGGVLGFGWPIFILVWFGLVKRSGSAIREGMPNLAA